MAAKLGFDKRTGGVQRVHNWRSRGIPAAIRLKHLALFSQASPTADNETAPLVYASGAVCTGSAVFTFAIFHPASEGVKHP